MEGAIFIEVGGIFGTYEFEITVRTIEVSEKEDRWCPWKLIYWGLCYCSCSLINHLLHENEHMAAMVVEVRVMVTAFLWVGKGVGAQAGQG